MNAQVAVPRLVLLVAPVAGLSAWPLAASLEQTLVHGLGRPAPTIVPIMLAASLAGMILGILVAKRAGPARDDTFSALPAKAGFLAALIAASILVLRATLIHGSLGRWSGIGTLTLFHAVIALLPATMFAMFMGGLAGAGRVALRGHPDSGKPAFVFQPIHALYALCLLALLSPIIPALLPKPVPRIAAKATPAPLPPTDHEIAPPPPPPFAYHKPEGFESAAASRLEVIATKVIPDVASSQPMLLSPDGRRLAFHQRSDSPRLAILDLDSCSEISRINLPTPALALAWSPDSSRLIGLFQSGEDRSLAVLVPQPSRQIPLPRPESFQFSGSAIAWPDASEVVLHPSQDVPLALNLDTLELRNLESAPFFLPLSPARKESTRKSPVHAPPLNAHRTLTAAWLLESARPRAQDNAPALATSGRMSIAAVDHQRPVRRHFPGMTVARGHGILFPSDGSKVLIAARDVVSIHYLGLREAPKVRWKIATRVKLDALPKADELKKQLGEKRLCAFVYPPLINPLNDKVVGASREKVKGIVRFLSWEDTTATVVLQDEFAPIAVGDILAIPHVWEDRQAKEIVDYAVPEWWAPIGDDGETNIEAVPLTSEIPLLEVGVEWRLAPEANAITFHEGPRTKPAPHPTAAPEPSLDSPPAGANRFALILRFIQDHHAKSSRGDVGGLMQNYAPVVDHYKSGLVSRDHVRAEEMNYHAPGYRVTERVHGAPTIQPLTKTRVAATYPLAFVRVHPSGTWTSGIADVSLEIELTNQGPRIVKQNSVTRESAKRRGDRNPPEL